MGKISIVNTYLIPHPGGSVRRRFTSTLSKEVVLLAQAQEKSEKITMIGRLILQKDSGNFIEKTCQMKQRN